MHFVVAVVGKPRDANLAGAIRAYEQRAGRYWPLAVHEVREEPARSGSVDLVRDREAGRLLSVVPPNARIVACELTGRGMSSEDFARWMQEQREQAVDVGILI